MIHALPAELFVQEGVWLIASAPLGKELTALMRQVVRTGVVESAYVPAFTSLENARKGIAWLSPDEPEELVPFNSPDLSRFKELLSALAMLGHAYLVLNPESDHRGERHSIRAIVKAIQRHLLGSRG